MQAMTSAPAERGTMWLMGKQFLLILPNMNESQRVKGDQRARKKQRKFFAPFPSYGDLRLQMAILFLCSCSSSKLCYCISLEPQQEIMEVVGLQFYGECSAAFLGRLLGHRKYSTLTFKAFFVHQRSAPEFDQRMVGGARPACSWTRFFILQDHVGHGTWIFYMRSQSWYIFMLLSFVHIAKFHHVRPPEPTSWIIYRGVRYIYCQLWES